MSELSVAIPDALRDWVESRIGAGHYPTAGDYVRSLIERDQADRLERDALVSALEAGELSGSSERRIPDIVAALRMRAEPK